MFDFDIDKYLTGCEMDGMPPFHPEHPGQPGHPGHPGHPEHCHKPHYTMTEQVEHTARAMRETIDRLLKFEKRLDDKMTCLGKKLTADNVIFKNTFASSFATFLADVKNEVNVFEKTLNADFELFKETVKTDYSTLADDCRTQIQENYNNFQTSLNDYKNELNSTYDSFRDGVESRLEGYNNNYSQAFNDYCTSINKKLADMESQFTEDYTAFANSVTLQISNFKTVWAENIDARLDGQDAKINDAILYLKTNLKTTLIEALGEMKESGELTELFGDVFNSINTNIENLQEGVTYLEEDVRYLDNASLPKMKIITPQMVRDDEVAGGVDNAEIDVPSLNRCIEKMTNGYTLYLGDYIYNIGTEALVIDNKHDIKIIGNGARIKASATPEAHSIFHLVNCSNVEISGVCFVGIEAENNVTPPAGHGDVKTCGSNRLGIYATSSTDLTFKNNMFIACTGDYWLVRDAEGNGPENVVIDGWESVQGHMGIYASGLKNATLKNIDIVPRVEIGAGNHAFYISTACENVTIENAVVKAQDNTYSCIIAHYTADEESIQPTTLTVRNLTAEGAFLYCGNEGSDVVFDNIKFTQIFENYLTNNTSESGKIYSNISYCASSFKNFKMKDSKIISHAETFYIDSGLTENVIFDNCEISITGTMLSPFQSSTKLLRSIVSCGTLMYSNNKNATTPLNVYIDSCHIGTTSNAISRRGTNTGIITVKNCDVSTGEGSRVLYHGETGVDSSGIRLIGCYFFGFTSFASDAEKAGGAYMGSYLNGAVIS